MSDIFLYLFITLSTGLLLKTIIQPRLILEYPYFMGGIFFIFLLPQAIILANQPYLVPKGTLTPIFAISFLCLSMAVIGYYAAPEIKMGESLKANLNSTKLKQIAVLYTVLGFLFLFLMGRAAEEMANSPEGASTQWSGPATIYFQLFQVINIAFPIFLYFAFRKPTFINILLALLAAYPSLQLIIFGGRREPTAFFLLSIALTAFYRTGFVPPRAAIVGAIVGAMLIIPAIGEYRAKAEEDPWIALTSIDLQESFNNYFKKGEHLEMAVAANIVDAYSFHGNYGFGAGYWNEMVFRYVPAQFVGKDFKSSLMIGERGLIFPNGYKIYPGLTLTCLGDSFVQFGYLGSIFFFFLGGFFKSLWRLSLTSDNPLIQIFYMISMVQALLSVTHATTNFLPGIFFGFVCLWFASVYAKED